MQTVSPYPGSGLVPASAFLFIPVPDCPDVRCRTVQHVRGVSSLSRVKPSSEGAGFAQKGMQLSSVGCIVAPDDAV